MKKYKTALVGLEGQHSDSITLGHMAGIRDILGVQKIYVVHITKIGENQKRHITREMEQLLLKFDGPDFEMIVKDGNPELEIPRIVIEKGIDLLVLGREPKPGMTHLLRQLTDTAKCSVLIVPKILAMKNCHLTPIDFSCNSKQAIKMAYYFKHPGSGKKISYSYPKRRPLHSRSYRPVEGHSKATGQNMTEKKKKIVPEDLIANCAIILEKRENLARKIISYSLNKGANLIMIGCKGTNQLASFLFGSIAIKIAEISFRLPILIEKKRRVDTETLEAFISV